MRFKNRAESGKVVQLVAIQRNECSPVSESATESVNWHFCLASYGIGRHQRGMNKSIFS